VSEPAASRPPSRRAEVVYVLIVLILFGVGGYVLWYRANYNIFPGQDATARVHWCERDYQNFGDPPQTWGQVTARNQYPVRDVGRYPPLGVPGQDLFAPIYPGAQPGSCSEVVYLRTGPGRYQPYVLLGGP
jgi:hypothetical protein